MVERVTLISILDGDSVVVSVDGWPVLFVRPSAGEVTVNDLRPSRSFAQRLVVASLFGTYAPVSLAPAGATGTEVRVGGRRLATLVVDPGFPAHCEVVVSDPASGAALLDVGVRYRQVDDGGIPGPGPWRG